MAPQIHQSHHPRIHDAVEAEAIAQEAFVFGMPLIYIAMSNDAMSHVSAAAENVAPMNQFGHHRRFPDAKSNAIVGMNVDTLYSLAMLDLAAEPLVLSVPPMGDRFWIMQILDGWNDVPAAPGARTVGGKGGNWVLVGPNWTGSLPEGIPAVHVPTSAANIGGRIYTTGSEEDYAAVHRLQDQLKLTPLSRWGTDYQPPTNVPLKPGVDAKTPIPKQVFALSAEAYFSRLAALLPDNPPARADAPVLERMAMLGISPGEPFDISGFDDPTRAAIEAGVKAGHEQVIAGQNTMGEKVNHWQLARDLGRYGTNYAYRATWTYFGVGGNLVEDAFYPTTQVDDRDQALTGEHRYRLHFTRELIPPVDAFWSLTLYGDDAYLVPNPIDRYALSGRDPMRYEADGSLTIYIQADDPGGEATQNWLPAPKALFRLALRLYSPKKQVVEGQWAPPPVQRVD